MRVLELILPFVLPTEAAAVIKIALKDVSAVNCKQVERHLLGRLLRSWSNILFDRSGPKRDGQENREGEAKPAGRGLHSR
jgi:hypothetical protein